MSYIRAGHELYDYKGEGESYVYNDGKEVIDYGDDYSHNPSLAQLIINIMRRVIDDEKYIKKMIKVLGKKLDVEVRETK